VCAILLPEYEANPLELSSIDGKQLVCYDKFMRVIGLLAFVMAEVEVAGATLVIASLFLDNHVQCHCPPFSILDFLVPLSATCRLFDP
jgi:hypothetical protein